MAASASPFAPDLFLATFLDSQLQGEGSEPRTFLADLARQGLPLSQAFQRLSTEDCARLSRHLPEATLRRLFSLSQERDPAYFFPDLLALGRSLAESGRMAPALALFSVIAQPLDGNQGWSETARREAEAILGVSSTGLRSEFLLRHFSEEASNPASLLAMTVGGLAFSAARAGALSRLLSSPRASLFTRGLGAEVFSGTLGFVAEVPSFVFASRGLHQALGQSQDWSSLALGRDLLGTGLVLSALRLSGAGGAFLAKGLPNQGVFPKLSKYLLPSASLLGGIMIAHGAEEYFGLRPRLPGDMFCLEALGTLLQFEVAGRLQRGLLGPGFAVFQQELKIRAEGTGPESKKESSSDQLGRAWAFRGRVPEGKSRESRLPIFFMMNERKDEEGKEAIPGRKITEAGPQPRKNELPIPAKDLEVSVGDLPSDTETEILVLEELYKEEPVSPPRVVPPTPPQPVASKPLESARRPTLPPPAAAAKAPPRLELKEGLLVGPEPRFPNGRYKVEGFLGKGGMGEVWKVYDQDLRRYAVMKVMRDVVKNLEHQARFRHEITIAANLRGKYTVGVHAQVELQPGLLAFVMDYVPGHDLATIRAGVDQGDPAILDQYPVERRVEIFVKICEAVAFIHDKGVIHRDLKPENIRIDSDGNVLLMDFGLAKYIAQGGSEPVRDLPPEALTHVSEGLTDPKHVNGTPGYIPREVMIQRLPKGDPRGQDIFALGVILYEWMTGRHPFAEYRDGDHKAGEPKRVPQRLQGGRLKIPIYASAFWGDPDPAQGTSVPSFREVLVGEYLPSFYELEKIALKAFAPNFKDRYASGHELRQAVLLAKSNAEVARLRQVRAQMKVLEGEMHRAWAPFHEGRQISHEEWLKMDQPIHLLRQYQTSWEEGKEELVYNLIELMKGEKWPEGRRIIAQASWERLIQGGARLNMATRKKLGERIWKNVGGAEDPNYSMLLALKGQVNADFRVVSFRDTSKLLNSVTLKVVPWKQSVEQVAHNGEIETGVYLELAPLVTGPLEAVLPKLKLQAGFYVFELGCEGFATLRVPVEVTLKQVRETIESGRPLKFHFEMVPEAEVPDFMTVIHRTKATIGHDYYRDGDPSKVYSFPMREIALPTFAVSRDPVTVRDYVAFIQSLLQEKKLEEAKLYMPRAPRAPRDLSEGIVNNVMETIKEKGVMTALKSLMSEVSGHVYYWTIKTEGKGAEKRYVLVDPSTHKDPQGDPISLDQPISGISYAGAEAYVKWRSELDGRPYRITTAEEEEAIGRNSFSSWIFPWGFKFDPFLLVSRQVFKTKDDAFPQPVGTHPLGEKYNRDKTLYGTREPYGNVRTFTSTEREPGTIVMFVLERGSMKLISRSLGSAFLIICSLFFAYASFAADNGAADSQVCNADFDGMSRDQQRTCFYYYRIVNQQLSLNLALLRGGKFDSKIEPKVDQGVSVDQGIRASDRAVDRIVDHNAAFGVSVDQGLRAVDQGVQVDQGLH
ncbi:MAG: protein kinase [Deltaproteobacteria bacterium]|nr:protein kinase [Deltaproteobacteria bacterium]